MDPKIEQLEEGNNEDEYHEFPKKAKKFLSNFCQNNAGHNHYILRNYYFLTL